MLKIAALLRVLRKDLISMLLAVRHRDTPWRVRGLFLAGILYLLSPFDLIPDGIPLAGIIDDALVVPAIVSGLKGMLPTHVRRESEMGASELQRRVPIIVGAATLFIVAWLALIAWGVYALIF